MCAAEGYKKLAELLGYPNSVHLRRILEYIMTDKEAELVVSLPGTNDELAKKLNMTVEELKPLITDLYKKGVIVPKNFETLEGMRFIPLPIFFHDRVLAMKNWSTQLPKLAELWDNFLELDYFSEAAKQYAKGEQPIERVFAYYKTIENNPETLPEDDVRTVLKQARVIGVVP